MGIRYFPGAVTLLVLLAGTAPENAWAQAETRTPTGGSNVTTRKCVGGTNAGAKCKQNSDCNSNNCFAYNRIDLTINMVTGTGAGWTPTAAQMTAIQNNFTTINNSMADATDGQMILGTVSLMVNNGAPNAVVQLSAGMCAVTNAVCTQDADCGGAAGSCALGGGVTNTGGWGSNGKISVGIGCIQNPLCFNHEFMHLVANVRDEYEGALDDGIDNNNDGNIDECNENQSNNRCFGGTNNGQPCTSDVNCPGGGSCRRITCIDPGPPAAPTSVTGCLMQCCLNNTGVELCTAANHDPNIDTEQSQCRNNNSCWTQFGLEWPSVMLLPAGLPAPGPAVAPAPVGFLTPSALDRFVAVIDRSDSMSTESPSRLSVAINSTKDFVDLLSVGTQFGLASFASTDGGIPNTSDATKDFPGVAGLQTINTAADRTAAKTAVDGLSGRAGGFTRIGAGLRQARDMLLEAGGTITVNTSVLLLTDGINNRPDPGAQADLDGALAELAAAGLPVFVTCIGEARDSVQCSYIADQTAGRFVDSATTASLYDAFVEFVAKAEKRGISQQQTGTPIGTNGLSPLIPALVEPGANSAQFVVSWEKSTSDLDLRLFQPGGAQVPLANRVFGTQGEFYRIDNPTPGTWNMQVFGASVPGGDRFSVRSIVDHRTLNVEAGLAKSAITWPEGFLINASPVMSRPIEGCQVSALVLKPNGSTETIQLSDDGKNGDAEAHDGLYQREYRNLTAGNGIYTFTVNVHCDQTTAAFHQHDDPGIGTFPGSPTLTTFDRVVRFSGTASSVPSNLPPVADICRDVRAECTGARTAVQLDGSCSSDPEGGALTYLWAPAAFFPVNGVVKPTGQFPLGRNVVSLVVTDTGGLSSAPDSGLVVIADTTAPVISSLTASPNSIWPPNHKMEAVTLTPTVVEVCDPGYTCKITAVSSNEPVNGLGDGDVEPDWEVTGNLTLNLRAERSGTGSGRIYTVTVSCSDSSGNSTSKNVTITVPINQR